MRFILKVISLPVVAVLSVAVMMLSFLVSCAGAVLKIVSFLAFLLGVIVAVASDPVADALILAGAFLISPFGLPLLANWLLDRMADANFALRDFITS